MQARTLPEPELPSECVDNFNAITSRVMTGIGCPHLHKSPSKQPTGLPGEILGTIARASCQLQRSLGTWPGDWRFYEPSHNLGTQE